MNLCEKFEFWTKKFIFHQISKIHEKWSKKVQFFPKKTKFCFARKKTSNYRELISKLALESPESTLCGRKALNAPKFNLTPEARLKAKNVVFGAKISRLFHFQISKKARLKTVTKTKALTCAIRLYDSNQASPMISSHSDEFRALNAPFFFHHRFHVFAIWAKKSHFFSKVSRIFFWQILKSVRFKAVTKSKFLTCTWRFWCPKEAIPGHS